MLARSALAAARRSTSFAGRGKSSACSAFILRGTLAGQTAFSGQLSDSHCMASAIDRAPMSFPGPNTQQALSIVEDQRRDASFPDARRIGEDFHDREQRINVHARYNAVSNPRLSTGNLPLPHLRLSCG